MNCQTAQAELVLLAYGELDRDTATAVTGHLQECGKCHALLAALRQVLAAITAEVTFPREAEVDWSLALTCRNLRTELSSFLGGAGSGALSQELMDHLARCTACTAEAAAIDATLDAVRGAFPREDQVDWDAFAVETARMARRQEDASPAPEPVATATVVQGPWGHRLRRALPAAAAVIAALGLGYMAARMTASQPGMPQVAALPAGDGGPAVTAAPPDTALAEDLLRRTRLELARADTARYLNDSRTLLASFTGLPVPCSDDNIDVSVESEVSTRLLRRKQLLERDLDDVAISRARRLADEVGSLLEEIALLQKCASPEKVQEIRELMAERQLMMRIKMLTDELGYQQPASPPARSARSDHA